MGSGAEKRQRMSSMLAAKMRRDGHTWSQIAEATGIPRDKVAKRAELGERLLSIEPRALAQQGDTP
jgi:hypothetical protein